MLEIPSRIEPALLEGHFPERLVNLAGDLKDGARDRGRILHPQTLAELADMVRVPNSYYSNLIEGDKTRPPDIERALKELNSYHSDLAKASKALPADIHLAEEGKLDAVKPAKRSLAIEAGIHVFGCKSGSIGTLTRARSPLTEQVCQTPDLFRPFQIAGITPCHSSVVVEREQVQPAVVEQGPHIGVSSQDVRHRLAGCLDTDRQAQRVMGIALSLMDRLPRQASPQGAAIAFDHADTASDIVQQLVAGAEGSGATVDP